MSEIRGTLEQIRRRLDESIRNAHPRPGEWVVLSNIVDDSGSPAEHVKDKLVMVLANMQKETVVSTYSPAAANARAGSYSIIAPPLYLNLFILFYANFTDLTYPEGLGVISHAISYFQQNPWFTHETLPELDPRIDKLTFEFANLDPVEANYLVGMMGARYLPCIFYKVRVIPFQADAVTAVVPAAQGMSNPSTVADPPLAPAEE